MFEWLKNYLLQQEIKGGPAIQKQFMSWENIKSIVILVDVARLGNVRDFVKQTGKNVDVIVVHPDKVSEAKDCFLSFNKKNFNFLGLPNQEAVKRLRQKSFDVLIIFDFNNSRYLKVLTGLASAKCKLGPEGTTYKEFFDISIQSESSDFLKQALKYLMMIKS